MTVLRVADILFLLGATAITLLIKKAHARDAHPHRPCPLEDFFADAKVTTTVTTSAVALRPAFAGGSWLLCRREVRSRPTFPAEMIVIILTSLRMKNMDIHPQSLNVNPLYVNVHTM